MIARKLANRCRRPRRFGKQRTIALGLLLLVWSMLMGWSLGQITQATPAAIAQLKPTTPTINDPLAPLPTPSPTPKSQPKPGIPGVDPVPPSYQLGQELYLETCGTCHLAVPPEVLPTATWAELLVQPRHYSVVLDLPGDPTRALMWNYLRNFSRPLLEDEPKPLLLDRSRYFKALHPDVDVPRPVKLGGCITCHPNAQQFDFRTVAN